MESELAAIQQRYERAVQIVHELSHEGRQWTMSLPADGANDPDIILRASLRDLNMLLIGTAKLLTVANAAGRVTEVNPLHVNEFKKAMDHLKTALQLWKES